MFSSQSLSRCPKNTSVSELAKIVHRDGGVVVEGLLTPNETRTLHDQLQPHVERRSPGFREDAGDDEFYGRKTVRIQGLAAKSRQFVDSILLNEILLGIADEILLPNCGNYWMSQAETIYIAPGNPAQALHRDDINWSFAAKQGIDLQMSALVALGDYDAEVGATMVVPSSHRDGYNSPIDASCAQPVEMKPGDALIYLGSLAHGGGANTSSDRVRKALYIGFLLGWLTPEEAVPLAIPLEIAQTLPTAARALLGLSSLRGNTATQGIESFAQLWQLDRDHLDQLEGTFLQQH
ncbi:MAG: phytanoyl-CoA dioxygenase family protein [Actinobacteria bacterium]|nr:phytanoyl-CoA dioxygenase family protein [Actinomycetota bacterium]